MISIQNLLILSNNGLNNTTNCLLTKNLITTVTKREGSTFTNFFFPGVARFLNSLIVIN